MEKLLDSKLQQCLSCVWKYECTHACMYAYTHIATLFRDPLRPLLFQLALPSRYHAVVAVVVGGGAGAAAVGVARAGVVGTVATVFCHFCYYWRRSMRKANYAWILAEALNFSRQRCQPTGAALRPLPGKGSKLSNGFGRLQGG